MAVGEELFLVEEGGIQNAVDQAISGHAGDQENPHGVTASQSGALPDSYQPGWDEITGKPTAFPPSEHNHDNRYYTETEMDTALGDKAGVSHKHDSDYRRLDDPLEVEDFAAGRGPWISVDTLTNRDALRDLRNGQIVYVGEDQNLYMNTAATGTSVPSFVGAGDSSPEAGQNQLGIVRHATETQLENAEAGNLVPTAETLSAEITRRLARESWQMPALQNGWVDFGAPYSPAAYYRTSGLVVIQGRIKNGAAGGGTTLFTLPSGYRPSALRSFRALSSGFNSTAVEIASSGQVSVAAAENPAAAQAYISLDGISFGIA